MTPIPVYVVDCKADCLVIAHQAQDMAVLALQAAVLAGALVVVALFAMLIVTGYRRH